MAFLNNTSPEKCANTVNTLINKFSSTDLVDIVTRDNLTNLLYFCGKGFEAQENEKFSVPLVWIGVYMAFASFVCILCMVADSLCAGMWNARYQISSKYTSLTVTSMMVITVAMKLTVDLTGSMPSNLDQMAKVGSIAFMCTIMAIFNPSLASMNNKTLHSNIIGLVIFIVTIIVNLFVEIQTDVIRNDNEGPKNHVSINKNHTWGLIDIDYSVDYANFSYSYIGIMFLLLLISISTAINIPSFKKILEFQYQVKRKDINDQQVQAGIPTVGEVTQHVTKYWIMAKTGSPQFVMSCNLLSYTSLLLCVTGMGIYIYMLATLLKNNAYDKKLESDYKWSVSVILWTQVIGNITGIVLVTIRCIRSIKFIKVTGEFTDLFKLRGEKYWDQNLSEWNVSRIGFHSDPRSRTSIVHFLKKCGLSLLVGFQKILIQLNRCSAYSCIGCLKLIIKVSDVLRSCRRPVDSTKDDIHLRSYVLKLDDKAQPSGEVLENITKSMNHWIERAKKKQNKDLLELLGKSNGFKGDVESFDGIGPLPLSVQLNSWSVPVITLTCIAIAVPDISKDQLKRLIESIDEALLSTRHVEKSFNSAREYANIRKTAITLWYELRSKCKWLENPIKRGACGQLPKDILTWFAAKAEPILNKANQPSFKETTGFANEFANELIAAHLMHRITRSILSKYPDKIQTNHRFFDLLSSMIADILVACFSNIPRVIKKKCHADEIEKREASVEAAVKLLGRTTGIIKMLETCEIPSIDPDKRGSIDEWRIHLKQSSIP